MNINLRKKKSAFFLAKGRKKYCFQNSLGFASWFGNSRLCIPSPTNSFITLKNAGKSSFIFCLTFISGKLLKFLTSFLLRIYVCFSIYFIVLLVEQRNAFCPLIAFWWVRSFIKSKSHFNLRTHLGAFYVDIFENVKLLGGTIYLLYLFLALRLGFFIAGDRECHPDVI